MADPLNIKAKNTMTLNRQLGLLFLLLVIFLPSHADSSSLAHHMVVELRPDNGEIQVKNTVTVAETVSRFEFVLNADLELSTPDGKLEALRDSGDGLRTAYRVTLHQPGKQLRLNYSGGLKFSKRRGMGGMPDGELSSQGVYLDSRSAWYPLFDLPFDRLRLEVKVPQGWQSISIGKRSDSDQWQHWSTNAPHDNLYLIAGPYTRHLQRHGDIDTSVWLLDDDPALARRYLGLIGSYIDHYSELIGDYPYAKFAVVENRWQTGFGMPSFTLLGSRVIRLPFIPFTSLPHEILHNWWGNGVWVDYSAGNWSEGLTAYLADHWMQERRGKGVSYRLKALQRYSNFAAEGDDMPLREFVSRHNDASQSIGYSKSLMLFHMLRQSMGDQAFVDGLRRLWSEHRFSTIGFDDAVHAITGDDRELLQLADQWLDREGAPRLALSDVSVKRDTEGYLLTLTLGQEQKRPFALDVPIAVMLDGEPIAKRLIARIDQSRERFEFRLPQQPLRIDIDPGYDVLRILDATEQPPALNRLFGGKALLVLPSQASRAERRAWARLARQWQSRYPRLELVDDNDSLDPLTNRLILGWDNLLLPESTPRIERHDQALKTKQAQIGKQVYKADDHNIVLVNSDPDGSTTGFIGATGTDAIAMLARKLPHYGSYGRLVFDQEAEKNQLKEALTSEHSRLSRQLGNSSAVLELPPETALGTAQGDPVGSRR